jgi:hypothetical protein
MITALKFFVQAPKSMHYKTFTVANITTVWLSNILREGWELPFRVELLNELHSVARKY